VIIAQRGGHDGQKGEPVTTIPGVTFRPIHQWPSQLTPNDERRSRHRFQATWTSTINLLTYELRMLDAWDIVIQLDLTERDIRLDGLPRAHAQPGHPGIILAFEAPRVGPVQFACDTYDHWHGNLRAVALTLQALRAVERYGAAKTGEQYRGWAQLPPPAPTNGHMTVEQAARFIAEQAGWPEEWFYVRDNVAETRRDAYLAAAQRLHPDSGGSHEAFTRLQEAKCVLDQHATAS